MPTNYCATRYRTHPSRHGSAIAGTRNGEELQTTWLRKFIELPDEIPSTELPRQYWATLNHLRSGVDRFVSSMKEWGLKASAECECGHPEQTVYHIIEDCLLYRPPNSEQCSVALDGDTKLWLASTELEI